MIGGVQRIELGIVIEPLLILCVVGSLNFDWWSDVVAKRRLIEM